VVTDQLEKWALALESLTKDKTLAAETVEFQPLHPVMRGELANRLPTIGNAWTRRAYDGGFVVLPARDALPALSLVFVQSKDGNTGTPNPAELGGGNVNTRSTKDSRAGSCRRGDRRRTGEVLLGLASRACARCNSARAASVQIVVRATESGRRRHAALQRA
jgi:hypothetical protein